MQLPPLQVIQRQLPELTNITPMAQGGQKLVYRATHPAHGEVVLKLILDSTADERTRREIEVAKNGRFTNVPKLHNSGVIPYGGGQTVYLLERFVEGETLHARLQRAGALPLDEGLHLLENLLVTAVELEQQQLVHRDIKPLNIILGLHGEVWLLDFGIARHLDKTSITATANHFGPHSAGYAAPEQFRNLKGDIDIRADLFSIGVVTYEVLTGFQPFLTGARDHLDVLRRTAALTPPALAIPGDSRKQLSGFVAMLMDKYPSRRPRTAQLALQWFRDVLPTVVQQTP